MIRQGQRLGYLRKDVKNFLTLYRRSSVTNLSGGHSTSSSMDPISSDSLRWKPTPSFSLATYKDLTKAKLSAFVVLTTMAGYAVAPGLLELSTLLWTTVGTGLCVASANAINQWIEVPLDSQMARTRNRVLVKHSMTPVHAFTAGIVSGLAGILTLHTLVNPMTACLGGTNIIIYTLIYTPLKRISIANTWAGAVVGAIPPMMGWAAATNSLGPGAWLLGAVLYAWQFPHFNSLAWNLRPDYSKAGYRMMAVTDPSLNARVSLRYALGMFPISVALPYVGVTTWAFAYTSSVVNGYMLYGAYKFWKKSNDQTARQLFFGSLVHLPVFLALLMVHKEDPTKMDIEDEDFEEMDSDEGSD